MAKNSYDNSETLNKKRIVDYKKLFQSPIGAKVLVDLVKRYNVMDPIEPFSVDDLNPQTLAYIAGCQAVIKDIIQLVHKDPMELRQEMAVSDDPRNY